jgi:hypothetical protein
MIFLFGSVNQVSDRQNYSFFKKKPSHLKGYESVKYKIPEVLQ